MRILAEASGNLYKKISIEQSVEYIPIADSPSFHIPGQILKIYPMP